MELIDLRYTLAMDRIREIPGENLVHPAFVQYFEDGAAWFLQMEAEESALRADDENGPDPADLKRRNYRLYEEILEGNYKRSWSNPAYAAEKLGEKIGPLLSSLRY